MTPPTAQTPAWRFRRAAWQAMEAFHGLQLGDLDSDLSVDALEALRTLWACSCAAGDPSYFARLAVRLADSWGCQPADLYHAMTPVELLDAHTQLAETGEEP